MSLVLAGALSFGESAFKRSRIYLFLATTSLFFPNSAHAAPLHHIPVATLEGNVNRTSSDASLWINLGVAIALVLLGGIFAGLTIAYVVLTQNNSSTFRSLLQR